MCSKRFILIGVDDRPNPVFTQEIRELLAQSRVFSGGTRHQAMVKELLPEGHRWIPITVPLEGVWRAYEEVFAQGIAQPVVVFASGDPLFFGFANTLMRVMPEAELRIFPSFHSLQILAHRIPLRYDDMVITSLTGRPWAGFDEAVIRRSAKIGVLTDRVHTPAAIAQRLLGYGYGGYRLYVGEHLGHPTQERVRCWSLSEAAQEEFACPNCVILVADEPGHRCFGLPDEGFEHLDGRSRMITKMPIRLLSLQALDLPARSVLWDVGFCTGSVSIEARLQFPHLKVCSFEIRPECEALIEANARRFGAPGLEVYMGDFLETDLQGIPAPDAVFIGGHGGRLKAILQRIRQVLKPGGCVVLNSVSDESRRLFEEGAQEAGFSLQPAHRIALDEFNPIVILKATFDSI